MKKDKIVAATCLVLLLFAFGAKAELCSAHSRTWKGRCFHNLNCAAVCVGEGATGGYCTGVVNRQCICTKDCNTDGPPDGDDTTLPPKAGVLLPPVVTPQPVLPPPVVIPEPVLPTPVVIPPPVLPTPVVIPPPVLPTPVVIPPPVAGGVLPPPVDCGGTPAPPGGKASTKSSQQEP